MSRQEKAQPSQIKPKKYNQIDNKFQKPMCVSNLL